MHLSFPSSTLFSFLLVARERLLHPFLQNKHYSALIACKTNIEILSNYMVSVDIIIKKAAEIFGQ